MRILYFSRAYSPHDHRFLTAIRAAGHEVFFLRHEPDARNEDPRPLPKGVKLLSGTLDRNIPKIQPDLIHSGPLHTCSYIAAKSGFRPLVQMSWGSDILLEARKRSVGSRVRLALEHADAFIGDCESVREAAMSFGMPRSKTVIFPWGVDLKQFSPRGSDSGLRKRLGWQHAFVLLHLRAWEPLYGSETVLRAFLHIAPKNPELRLLMPGSGSQRALFERLVQRAGLQDRVHFAGPVAQKDLPAYYRAADLYLSASQSDGSSVSLMEALASGLPALVSDIPGNREWVRPGKEGWLFPVGDERALAALIEAAMQFRKLDRMAKQARSTAEKKADWSKNQAGLQRAYAIAMKATRK
jgi:glycosyltransferase involved in cell wall biosynthesis